MRENTSVTRYETRYYLIVDGVIFNVYEHLSEARAELASINRRFPTYVATIETRRFPINLPG